MLEQYLFLLFPPDNTQVVSLENITAHSTLSIRIKVEDVGISLHFKKNK